MCTPGSGFVDQSTKKDLLAVVEQELVKQHVSTLLSAGFDSLVASKNVSDCKILFRLLSRVDALDPLFATYQSYIMVFLSLSRKRDWR